MKLLVRPVRGALVSLLAVYARLPRFVRWLAPLVWAAAIWWASSQSRLVTVEGAGWTLVANSAHFVIFGALAGLVFLAGEGSGHPGRVGEDSPRAGDIRVRRRAWFAFGLTVVYAVVDELHQAQVPGRDASVWDVASDAVGALWFTAVLLWLEGAGRGWATLALLPVGLMFAALATFG